MTTTTIRIAYSALPEGFDLSRPDAIAEVIEQALRESGIPAEASDVLSHMKIELPTAQLGAASRTLAEIHHRLKPGAPFVVAHFSFPQTGAEKNTWLSRYAAFATASGVPAENLKNATAAIREATEKVSTTAQKLGAALYAQADAAGAAGAGEAAGAKDDDVVDAEIIDDEKPKGGAA